MDIPASIEGYPVTSIGNKAFQSCTSLTSVNIPSSVTSIGYRTFYDCKSLTSVNIPYSVTSIGDEAFWGCTSLTSVNIPSSISYIEESAFCNCTSLTSVNIPSSVTSIGYRAFAGCTSLTSVNIPSSVTSIGDYVFSRCTSLTSVSIPSSVTSIGDYVFSHCTSLTSVSIPSSVTSIGNNAFEYCISLTSVNIPSSLSSIGKYAFEYCTSLTSINIPSSVTSIENNAFYGCTSLTSVNIPSSVTSIGDSAFCGCTSLTSVSIPSSVTSIGGCVFDSCTSLTSVSIPSSVTSIESYAFYGCTSLTSVSIPSSVTSIGGSAFRNCTSLTSVNIPSSVTSIGDSTFYYCTSLRAIAFSSKNIKIGSDTFVYCPKLKHVHIPEGSVYTDFYKSDNYLPYISSYYYIADGEGTCSLGKKCPFIYDELLEQYTVKVIDGETGDIYVNAIVKSKDGKYSAVTDENGRAAFNIPDDDDYFWNNDIDFEVYFDESTKLGSEYAESDSISEELSGNSNPKKVGQKNIAPNKNSQNDIVINKNKFITAVSYKSENVLSSKHYAEPMGSYKTIYVNESYDAVKYTPTNDKLTINFSDEVPGSGYTMRIYITNAREIKTNNGTPTGNYQSVMICDEEIGNESSKTYDSFSDIITKKINDDHEVTIRPDSRILIQIFKPGVSLTKENDYYLTPNIGVFSNAEIQNMGLFDGKKLQESLGTFNAALPIPENDYFEANLFLDLTKNQVGFEASLGCNFEDNRFEESHGEYDFKNLKDCISRAEGLDIGKQFEQIKNQKYDEKFGFYFKPLAKVQATGTITDTTVILEGNLQAGLTAGFTGTWRIKELADLAHIDAAVDIEGMGKAGFSDFTITRPQYRNIIDFNKPFQPNNVTFDLSATGKLGAGIGLGDIVDATVTASLTGETSLDISEATWKNVSLSGDLIAKEKILCYEASQDLANAKFVLVDKDGNTCGHMEYSLGNKRTVISCPICEQEELGDSAEPENVLSPSDFRLIERSGEEQPTASTGDYSYDEELGNSLSSEQIIAKNVYKVSDPVLVNAGGTDYMFRFIDNTERSAANCSTLAFSKKTGDTWSAPVMISNDGTADFDASVCTDGKDIYISWCNISEQLSDDASYTTAIEKSTVSVAKLDTTNDSITLIGTASVDGKSALSPSVSVRNGKGIVAWTSNSQFDPINNTGNDSIYYSTISNDTLSSPTLYASTGAGKAAGVVETGYMGSDLCIVYGCMDADSGAYSSELYGSVYTSSPKQLTSNSVPDTNPQFEKLNGKDTLFWYRDKNIVYSDSLGGNASTALSGIIGDRYAIASSDNVTKIAWRDKTDEGNILKMVSYEDGAFTNNYIGNALGADPSAFTATVDSNNMLQIAYTYLDGNSYTLAVTDEIEDEKAAVTYAALDSSYKSGDPTAKLKISVYNSGNRNLDSADITIADGTGNIIGTYPISSFDLMIGETKDYEFDVALPTVTDYTTFTVSIADIACEPATFEAGFAEMYLTGDVYEAGGMRFADITVHNDSTVASSGTLAVIIDDVEVARSQLSTFDCNANSLNEFNLSELMDGNKFSEVKFVLEGTKKSNYAGATTLVYNYGSNAAKPEADVADNIKLNISDGTTRLSWDAIDGADTYYIYRYLDGKFTLCGSTYKLSYMTSNIADAEKCGFIVVSSDKCDLNQYMDKVVYSSHKRTLEECIDYINNVLSQSFNGKDIIEITTDELEMINTVLDSDYSN